MTCRIFKQMRCLVVADLHYSLPQFDWLLSAGTAIRPRDLCGRCARHRLGGRFPRPDLVVKKYLARLAEQTRVILCSGNHDLDDRNAEGEKYSRWIGEVRELGIACDGDDLMIGDTLFTVCPWWDGPLLRQRIDAQLGTAAAQRAKRWIWVHHAPPANSPTSWGGKRYFGDTELVQWIERYRPDMVISGHVHQSPFIHDGSWFDRLGSTWVFNTGLQPGRPPTHIVLEIDENRAYWLAAGEAQWIDLNAPVQRPAAASRRAAGLAHILGSDSRSEPGATCSGGRLIILCRTSPTISRWVPCPAYCFMRSAR